ncbi:MAG: hypothetical protein ACXVCM_06195 [Ktedonobacteraceae bacterium]
MQGIPMLAKMGLQRAASPCTGARGRASGGCKSGSSHPPLLTAAAGGKREKWKTLI